LKNLVELKNKVTLTDYNDIYKNFSNRMGNININTFNLKKIKDLDGQISKFGLNLVKELMKIDK
jgi:hypothetical protein